MNTDIKLGCIMSIIFFGSMSIWGILKEKEGNYVLIATTVFLILYFILNFFIEEKPERMNEEIAVKNVAKLKENERLKNLAIEELKKLRLERLKKEWEKYYQKRSFSFVYKLSGIEFESFMIKLFRELNYSKIQSTDAVGDQGIDILFIDLEGNKVGVQAKRHHGNIGNSAVQQLLGGMLFYSCDKGIVVTSSGYTQSAIDLSEKDSRISLWSGDKIEKLYHEIFPSEVPPLSIEIAKRFGLLLRARLSPTDFDEAFQKHGLDYRDYYSNSDIHSRKFMLDLEDQSY